jgi:hypothetical protein
MFIFFCGEPPGIRRRWVVRNSFGHSATVDRSRSTLKKITHDYFEDVLINSPCKLKKHLTVPETGVVSDLTVKITSDTDIVCSGRDLI